MKQNRKRLIKDHQSVTGIQRKQLPLFGGGSGKVYRKGGSEMGIKAWILTSTDEGRHFYKIRGVQT